MDIYSELLELQHLPGGSHRMMFCDEVKMKKETLWQRIKRRMPDQSVITKFWRPTQCKTCYWSRLGLVAVIGSVIGWWVSILFLMVALYYAARPENAKSG